MASVILRVTPDDLTPVELDAILAHVRFKSGSQVRIGGLNMD